MDDDGDAKEASLDDGRATTDHTAFYVEVLESRLRFLDREIAKVERWDELLNALSAERDDVEHELDGLRDDMSRKDCVRG